MPERNVCGCKTDIEVSITGVVEGGFHAWGLVRLLSRHYQDNKL